MATSKHTLSQQAIEEEWELVQAAQKNPARFGVLYDRYYEQIFRFIYKRTAEEELTADLCSQVFFKAMQNLKKYKFKGVPFSAWLYRIASNEVNQFFRSNQKKRVVSLEDKHIHHLKDEFGIEDKKMLETHLALLQDVIQLLKPAEVEILELRFFEQRPFKEIGDILDITENNAKVKVYRLLQKMKKLFQKQR